MKKKLLALAMVIMASLSLTTSVYAAGTKQVTLTTDDTLVYTDGGTSLGDEFQGMAPGDTRTISIELVNKSNNTASFFISGETITALEEANSASGAAYEMSLTVGEGSNAVSLLNMVAGGYADTATANIAGLKDITELKDYQFVRELAAGESAQMHLTLSINGEGTDNNYFDSVGRLSFNFRAYYEAPTPIVITNYQQVRGQNRVNTVVEDRDVTVVKSAQTGDVPFLPILLGVFAVGAIVLFAVQTKGKKRKAAMMMLVGAFVLTAMPSNVFAASAKTYTVTFRTGNVAHFDTTKMVSTDQVTVTDNYISFVVERDKTLSGTYDNTQTDAQLQAMIAAILSVDDGYFLLGASEWTGADGTITDDVITKNAEYVLDYGTLVNPVPYTISYVDSSSGERLAPSTIAYGEMGAEISCVPLTIAGYAVTEAATTMTLNENGTNEMVFHYSYTGTVTNTVNVFVPGTTTTNTVYNDVVTPVPAVAPVAPAAPAEEPVVEGEGEEPVEEDLVDLEDEEVPLGADEEADGEGGNEEDLVDVEDEEVPLGAEQGMTYLLPILGILFAVIIAGVVVIYVVKKKKVVKK